VRNGERNDCRERRKIPAVCLNTLFGVVQLPDPANPFAIPQRKQAVDDHLQQTDLDRYCHGVASAHVARKVEAHLQTCRDCSRMVAFLIRTGANLRRLGERYQADVPEAAKVEAEAERSYVDTDDPPLHAKAPNNG
jgi:hypothetical protein